MSEYISKEELKDYLEKNISFGGTEKKFRFYDIIDSLPPADVRPNIHGHWEVVSLGYGDNAYICECSECKDTVWVYVDADRKFNFCPNCGADMREPKGEKGD